jgi:hypothetical protein
MTFCGFVLPYFTAVILNVASNIKIESNKMSAENLLPKSHVYQCAVELYLARSPIIRIGLALRVNLSRILQDYLALKLTVIGSSTVQCYDF